MRLFVGIDIPDDLRRRIAGYAETLRDIAPGVRWVQPETLHVTLKFIGETQLVEQIKSALARVEAAPFEITFRDVGFFTPRQPRVFWIGVHASEALPELAARIDLATASRGIEREEKPYKPHLTLARAGSGNPHEKGRGNNGLAALRDRIGNALQLHFGTMQATEFILYQSRLSPKGARYTKLEQYTLKA
jgi:2'-5' RNA ligase